MRLPHRFIKLPLVFDHARLAEEISQFDEGEWRQHPQRFVGNSSLVLVSTNGAENDDFTGPMRPSPRLGKTPYIRQVMASFNTVIGRSRLMRLTPGGSVDDHSDTHYFWRNHLRIHVPIITEPEVAFYCADEQVHMAAGESWTFDNWLSHSVENRSDKSRIHLVIDTVGSTDLWKMVDGRDTTARRVEFDEASDPALQLETYPGLPILPPVELGADLWALVDDVARDGANHLARQQRLRLLTSDFLHDWQSQWMLTGPTAAGLLEYKRLLNTYRQQVDELSDRLLLKSNGRPFNKAISATLDCALVPENFSEARESGKSARQRPRFDRPVFIVAAPRSGSTLLFESLLPNRELWSVGDETHRHFEGIPGLRPSRDNQSNRLTGAQATPAAAAALLDTLAADLVNSDGRLFRELPMGSRPTEVRFLEKTPKNALRIPFILKVFPDACFIFLFRDARQNLSSLLDSWRSRRYVTYPRLPGWPATRPWSHLLIPGWQRLIGSSPAEIVAQQWLITNQTIVDDLQQIPRERWCVIEYDALIADTMNELQRLCAFSQIIFGPRMVEVASAPLKPSKYTLTTPEPDKWKKNADELAPVLPSAEALMSVLRTLR